MRQDAGSDHEWRHDVCPEGSFGREITYDACHELEFDGDRGRDARHETGFTQET